MSWRIGTVEVTRIEENVVPLPTKVLLPDVTQKQIDADREWLAPYFDEPGEHGPVMRLSIHSFVVVSGDTTIVVDTCVGTQPERPLPGDGGFVDSLDAGIDGGLAGVDVVVCTHAHFDHVGWNTRLVDGVRVPTFPNARYLITAAEMAELEADDHMAVMEPAIAPLVAAGVLDVVEPAGPTDCAADQPPFHAITDEVALVATPGHTAGHVSVLIESAGATGLITGDAFHSPLQLAHPELAAWRFDSDSERSTKTRRSLIERFVDTEAVILGTHFAPPSGGTVTSRGGPAKDRGGPVRFVPVDG